ncbi:hypothetical protein LH51_17200 [Nitrincola sp. A-D6]|uniref:hypothetical protein n=1 Tax=Nitrincola sp. A-D6 TaxID=1545442 RepID=UPI00051FC84B|nr:hypothetical protein [Nitrincola sp. A-D6]KGK41123.1 hypothetical protein LH51_17200 [Nitrincola sp. A-D6]
MLNPDGSSEQLAHWNLTQSRGEPAVDSAAPDSQQIAKAEQWLRSGTYASNNTIEASYRIHDHNLIDAPKHLQLSGAGASEAEFQGGPWQINAKGNYLLHSQQSVSLTGKTVDIGEYSIAARHQGETLHTAMNLGHHSLGLDSFLFSPQQRRGLSFQFGDSNNRLSTQLFAVRPDAIVGSNHLSGVSDPRSRLQGFAANIQPFSEGPDALAITAMYYDGEGSTSGLGVSESHALNKGSGWGLMLEKSYWQGRLNLSGEHAHSRFDPDISVSDDLKESSDAWRMKIDLRPFTDLSWANQPVDLLVGAEYQRIDTFFASLANPGLAADRDMASVFSDFYWGRLFANVQLSHETNNVDKLQGMPTDRLRSFAWNGNYAFNQQTGSTAWLGTPYLQLSGFTAKLDRHKTPDGYLGFDTDNMASSLTVGGGSNYQDWYWSGNYTHADFDDKAGMGSDTRSRFLSLAAGWQVHERLSLNTDVQYGIFSSKAEDSRSYNTNINLGVAAKSVSEKLDFNLNYNLNLSSGDSDLPDRHRVNAQLGWTIFKASQSKPGVSIALRGSMENNHGKNTYANGRDRYQVFATLRISAPLAGGF